VKSLIPKRYIKSILKRISTQFKTAPIVPKTLKKSRDILYGVCKAYNLQEKLCPTWPRKQKIRFDILWLLRMKLVLLSRSF